MAAIQPIICDAIRSFWQLMPGSVKKVENFSLNARKTLQFLGYPHPILVQLPFRNLPFFLVFLLPVVRGFRYGTRDCAARLLQAAAAGSKEGRRIIQRWQ